VRLPIARVLAIIAGLIAVGEWMVFVPFFAMAEDGRLHRSLVITAFLALPLAAAGDLAGARLLSRQLWLARRLLAGAAVLQLFVEGSLAFPLFIGGIVALGAAALAISSRPSSASSPSDMKP